DGGITTLLGANGAGKTTTLRAICNMVRNEGSITFDGKDLVCKPAPKWQIVIGPFRIPSGPLPRPTEEIVRHGIAHVPEGRGTFSSLTVDENLRIAAYTLTDKQR